MGCGANANIAIPSTDHAQKKNVDIGTIKVQVCVYIFDLLYINGTSLVTKPLSERRKLLFEHFQEVEGEWKFATALNTNDMDEVQQFLEESIKGIFGFLDIIFNIQFILF